MSVALSRSQTVLLLILTGLALAILYVPSLYLLAVSFNPALQPGLPSLSEITLKWYLALPGERGLLGALQQSLVVATLTAILATGLSLLAALGYVNLWKYRRAWFLTVIMPMFVPGVIQGLALSAVFSRLGILASSLTIVAGHLLWAMPFAFIVILTSFAAVKPSYGTAATDLGANAFQVFRDITLPLIRPGLISAFVFSFLISLNEFTRALYLAGRQNTLPVVLFGKMNGGAQPTIYAMSGAILMVSAVGVAIMLLVSAGRSRPRRGS